MNGALSVQGYYHDIQGRIDCANEVGASILLAIHFNVDNSSARGTETFYDSARPFSSANQSLGELIQTSIIQSFAEHGWEVPDRGITDDGTLDAPALSASGAAYGHLMELGPAQPGYLDRPSQMPGALLEALFITSPVEADVAASSEGQSAIAVGLERAVLAYSFT